MDNNQKIKDRLFKTLLANNKLDTLNKLCKIDKLYLRSRNGIRDLAKNILNKLKEYESKHNSEDQIRWCVELLNKISYSDVTNETGVEIVKALVKHGQSPDNIFYRMNSDLDYSNSYLFIDGLDFIKLVVEKNKALDDGLNEWSIGLPWTTNARGTDKRIKGILSALNEGAQLRTEHLIAAIKQRDDPDLHQFIAKQIITRKSDYKFKNEIPKIIKTALKQNRWAIIDFLIDLNDKDNEMGLKWQTEKALTEVLIATIQATPTTRKNYELVTKLVKKTAKSSANVNGNNDSRGGMSLESALFKAAKNIKKIYDDRNNEDDAYQSEIMHNLWIIQHLLEQGAVITKLVEDTIPWMCETVFESYRDTHSEIMDKYSYAKDAVSNIEQEELHPVIWNPLCELLDYYYKNENANINQIGEDKKTLLQHAVAAGQTQLIDFLLANGAAIETNIYITDMFNLNYIKSSALIAAIENGHRAIAAKLIDHGADISFRDTDKTTPILAALKSNQIELAIKMLDKRETIPEEEMDDLLEIAMQRNNTEIIEKLLTFGASPLKQVNDLSPVIHAIQERNCPLLDRLLQCV